MTLKLVELQVALPRSQDAGKLHDQMQQRGQQIQDHLGAAKKIEDDRKRKKVSHNDKKEKSSLQLGAKTSNTTHTNPNRNEEDQLHPYKGKKIDISG